MMKRNSTTKHIYDFLNGSGLGLQRHFAGGGGTSWQPSNRSKKRSATFSTLVLLFFIVAALVHAGWSVEIDSFIFSGASSNKAIPTPTPAILKTIEFPLQCAQDINVTQTCPRGYPRKHNPSTPNNLFAVTCPSYFRWIHEDLRPWRETGITRDMVERARRTAHFRLVTMDGKA